MFDIGSPNPPLSRFPLFGRKWEISVLTVPLPRPVWPLPALPSGLPAPDPGKPDWGYTTAQIAAIEAKWGRDITPADNDKLTQYVGEKQQFDTQKPSSQSVVSSSEFGDGESLRVTFDTSAVAYPAYWYGNIEVYNLNAESTDLFFTRGAAVAVYAGYENGVYGKIFEAPIFQVMWERENVVDNKLTLRCIIGLDNNLVNFSAEAFSSQAELVRQIAARALNPITIDRLSSRLEEGPRSPRKRTFFGDPRKYFDQIATQNQMQWWMSETGLNIGSLNDPDLTQGQIGPIPAGNALVYTPETGLVGTPQQTQDGVDFRVLLDARLRVTNPPMSVKLDQSSIRLLKAQIGQLQNFLDVDGVYKVAGVRHYGDTRGNPWYTEIVGVSVAGGRLTMLEEATADPNHPRY
jgi:hypothetical protein